MMRDNSENGNPTAQRRPYGVGPLDPDGTKCWYHLNGALRGSEQPVAGKCGRKLVNTNPPRYCTQHPLRGRDACAKHGGRSLRGPAHPGFKNGQDSYLFPKDMRAANKRAKNNPNRLALEKDIEALETKQHALFAKMNETDAPPWGEAVEAFNDYRLSKGDTQDKAEKLAALGKVIREGTGAAKSQAALWAEFREIVQEKEKLVTAERNWLAKLRTMYTAEQGLMLQYAIMEAAKNRFGDQPDKLADFLDDALRLLDDPDKPKQVEAE